MYILKTIAVAPKCGHTPVNVESKQVIRIDIQLLTDSMRMKFRIDLQG